MYILGQLEETRICDVKMLFGLYDCFQIPSFCDNPSKSHLTDTSLKLNKRLGAQPPRLDQRIYIQGRMRIPNSSGKPARHPGSCCANSFTGQRWRYCPLWEELTSINCDRPPACSVGGTRYRGCRNHPALCGFRGTYLAPSLAVHGDKAKKECT